MSKKSDYEKNRVVIVVDLDHHQLLWSTLLNPCIQFGKITSDIIYMHGSAFKPRKLLLIDVS